MRKVVVVRDSRLGVDIYPDRVRFGRFHDEKLTFTYEEWNAFVAGVLRGEFDFDNLPTPASGHGAGEAGEGVTRAPSPAGSPTGPPSVNPPEYARPGQDPEVVLAVAADGESCLPEAAHPIDSPDAPAEHSMTAAWGGVPGQCGVQCACGTAFDGFDTIGEAAELLDDHIAAAVTEDSPAGRPDPAKGEVFDGACAIDLSPAGRGPDSSGGEGGSVSRPPVMAAGAVAATPATAPAVDQQITDEMVAAYHRACGAVWSERSPITQGEAVMVDREATRAGLAAAVELWEADRYAVFVEALDLDPAWGSGALVQHVPESSSAAGGDSTDDPVATMNATGGEVVPDPVGVREAGTTEPIEGDGADR